VFTSGPKVDFNRVIRDRSRFLSGHPLTILFPMARLGFVGNQISYHAIAGNRSYEVPSLIRVAACANIALFHWAICKVQTIAVESPHGWNVGRFSSDRNFASQTAWLTSKRGDLQ
jgi:hypothetical protein